ncbi:UDP-N-acetylmuramate--L-alanine ligase [Woodsholea maritima]|uniref:UDP-N-acetylmuramate--L-alanine ligase n=1 Tax=Woodsholea maritima TaxID=240237 RepID=UPI0003665020|nr:Mur ligase family protein [Woodsholea maritima]
MTRTHFIGIGGVGMSAVATLAQQAGDQVSGSDYQVYPPASTYLEERGFDWHDGYSPANIPAGVDRFVIGMNAKLNPEVNDEVKAAMETGQPIFSFASFMSEILKTREPLVVAGSSGKSTTTAIAAWLLRACGVEAGYMIGARAKDLATTADLGEVPTFVIEGDEYPSNHFDPSAKFLHYCAHDVIVTSVSHDHVNVYPTVTAFEAPFRILLADLPAGGIAALCANHPRVVELAKECPAQIVTYGVDVKADWCARHVRAHGAMTVFELFKGEQSLGQFETQLIGAHNVQNIVGVIAWAVERGLITPEAARAALSNFRGIARRLERVSKQETVPVYEGFGSSLEKTRAAITALKDHFGTRALTVVFEPHAFSWRNRAMLSWYDTAFLGAARVFILPPEEQGKAGHDQSSHEEILARANASGVAAEAYDRARVIESVEREGVVLILTSGNLEGDLFPLCQGLDAAFA